MQGRLARQDFYRPCLVLQAVQRGPATLLMACLLRARNSLKRRCSTNDGAVLRRHLLLANTLEGYIVVRYSIPFVEYTSILCFISRNFLGNSEAIQDFINTRHRSRKARQIVAFIIHEALPNILRRETLSF